MKLLMLQREAGHQAMFYTPFPHLKLSKNILRPQGPDCPVVGEPVSKLDNALVQSHHCGQNRFTFHGSRFTRRLRVRERLRLRRACKQTGATLVEVVIAATVLAIMIAGVLNSFGYGFMASQLARENQRATQVMLEKVETLRLYSWSQINSNGFVPTSWTEAYDNTAVPGQQGCTYTGTVNIASVPFTTSYSSNMRQVTVTLNWTTRGRLPHTRSITTYVSKDGLQNYVW
ncbi:MAG: hypothetical protein C5B50_02060 [Verrucomicrobia bacterium]|nr:MAG: hypothetical protein C5B50_02060 [Verrucomicrobiota bacterium]